MSVLYLRYCLLLFVLKQGCASVTLVKPNILGPPLTNRPFVVAWNVATERCKGFGVDLDLSDFDIVHNPDKSWQGSTLTIFYSEQMGLYPSFDKNGQPVNGGLPQLVNFTAHLDKVAMDVKKFIPDEDFQGLAVIDWESWLPLFERSTWGVYKIYRNKSIEKVKAEHPHWTYDQQVAQAQVEFDTAARQFIDFTLRVAKTLRPKALWGLYLYPDCYNYAKSGKNFTCSNETMQYNDEIHWVFDDSTALYPSVYLGDWFKDNAYALDYVANRVREAMRVDFRRPGGISIPVFAYHSITYRKELQFLDYIDLRDSIGITSLLGASGMVIWGDYYLANSTEQCKKLSDYISFTFGPFCKKTSDAASKCSVDSCNGHGRCVVVAISEDAHKRPVNRYLTVSEATELVHSMTHSTYKIYDRSLYNDKMLRGYSLTCQCFTGWSGKECNVPETW